MEAPIMVLGLLLINLMPAVTKNGMDLYHKAMLLIQILANLLYMVHLLKEVPLRPVECMVVEGSNAASYDTANRPNETRAQSSHRRTGELFGQSSGTSSYRYTDYAARKA